MTEATELDRTLGFAILDRNARGRLVRLGPVLEGILSAHAYPLAIERLLAEALTLTALLGATLKDHSGQMTLQAKTEGGAVDLLVCDYKDAELRGYVQFDPEKLALAPADPSLFGLFGKGYLAITFDQALTDERYQGIVPLEGGSLAEAAQSYFSQSEQIPSLVRLAHHRGTDGRCVSGGLLLQHLPEGEAGRDRLHTRLDHPEWQHIDMLGRTVKDEELTDPTLPMETLLWRLFHEEREVRVLGGAVLTRGCRCSRKHILSVLARFPADERQAMADDDGMIGVDCKFCSISHPIALAELDAVE